MTFRARPTAAETHPAATRARLRVVTSAVALCVVLCGPAVALGASVSGAQAATTPTTLAAETPDRAVEGATTQPQLLPSPPIIPEPNTGHEPRDPGDRGGWWQEALFFIMCGAMLFIGGLVWRDSRRQRRRQGRLADRADASRPHAATRS